MITSSYAYFVWTVVTLTSWLSLLASIWLSFILGEGRYLFFAVFWLLAVIFMAGITSSKEKPKGFVVSDPDRPGETKWIKLD